MSEGFLYDEDEGFIAEDGGFLVGDQDDPCCCTFQLGACTVCSNTGVYAQYYNADKIGVDIPLGGDPPPVLQRIEDGIDLNATGSPAPGVITDNFCIRWTFWLTPEVTGTHTLYFTSQHAVRVYVNASTTPSLNQWTSHSSTTHSFTVSLTKGTPASIVVEFRNDTGTAICKMEWSYTGQAQTLVPKRNMSPGNNSVTPNQISFGTTGTYFPNLTLTPPGVVPTTSGTGPNTALNFAFAGSPTSGIPTDNWSARYEGYLRGPILSASTTDVTLYVTHKDGARMWFDGVLVIDNWNDTGSPVTDTSAPVTMKMGHYYPIVVEFYNKTGTATIKLEWSYTGQSQITPNGNPISTPELIRGTVYEVVAETILTFSGVTLDTGCRQNGSVYNNISGSLNGTFCADRASGCAQGVLESPGTTVVTTQYPNPGCTGTPTPIALSIDVTRTFGRISVSVNSGSLFSGSAASFDCNETVVIQNDNTTVSGSVRGTGGQVIVTPGMCS